MTPAEFLHQFESNLYLLPPNVGAWLAAGLRRYRHGMALEAALELSGHGARRYRDEALRRAADLIAPNERLTTQARELLKAIRYFEPRYRKRYHTQTDLTGWRLELWRAFASGVRVPTEERQLRRILDINI